MGNKVKINILEEDGVDYDEVTERALQADLVEVVVTTNGYVNDDVQACLEEGDRKRSGSVAPGSFTGNPKTFVVTFSSALPDANYHVTIVSGDSRVWSAQSLSASGFTINTNANQALTTNVTWKAEPIQDIA